MSLSMWEEIAKSKRKLNDGLMPEDFCEKYMIKKKNAKKSKCEKCPLYLLGDGCLEENSTWQKYKNLMKQKDILFIEFENNEPYNKKYLCELSKKNQKAVNKIIKKMILNFNKINS